MTCPACGRPDAPAGQACAGCGALRVPRAPPRPPRPIDPWEGWSAPAPPAQPSLAAAPGPTPGAIPADRFYATPAPPPERSPLQRATATDLRYAVALVGAGTVAVFVSQAAFLQQLLFGAPIFEECLKAGLALLPWAALRVRALAPRLATALAAGAGFGWLEHALAYADESDLSFALRLAFHALAAALSMATLAVLRPEEDPLLRLGATLPATLIHYANNGGALLLALLGLAYGGAETVAFAWSLALTVLALVLTAGAAAWGPWYRRWLAARLARPSWT